MGHFQTSQKVAIAISIAKFNGILNGYFLQIFSKSITALRHLTFDLYQDEITILMGQNGSGKSTLISIIGGK